MKVESYTYRENLTGSLIVLILSFVSDTFLSRESANTSGGAVSAFSDEHTKPSFSTLFTSVLRSGLLETHCTEAFCGGTFALCGFITVCGFHFHAEHRAGDPKHGWVMLCGHPAKAFCRRGTWHTAVVWGQSISGINGPLKIHQLTYPFHWWSLDVSCSDFAGFGENLAFQQMMIYPLVRGNSQPSLYPWRKKWEIIMSVNKCIKRAEKVKTKHQPNPACKK